MTAHVVNINGVTLARLVSWPHLHEKMHASAVHGDSRQV